MTNFNEILMSIIRLNIITREMNSKRIITLAAMSSLLPASVGILSAKTNTEKRPNVIFILMDDAGYGDFGCYGQTKIETPNIDALARNGILFTDMYSGAPVSAPARCTLLTGLHLGHAQIRSNDELKQRGNQINSLLAMEKDPSLEGQAPMAKGTKTIATLMRDAGYRTAMMGKWGLGNIDSGSVPTKMGFDEFYGHLCQRVAHCYYPMYLYRNETREYLDNPPMEEGQRLKEGADPYDESSYKDFVGNRYAGDAIYDNMISFIRKNQKHEFFLMWTTTVPHSAMQAPKEYVDYYVKKFGDEKPVYELKNYFPCRYPRATYAAMITYFDYQVGEMVKELKSLGIYDNTIIFFTSDNGPTHNALSSTSWFDSAHPFRSDCGWVKRSLHEGGIREPFIVSWNAKIKPRKSDHIGYFPDILPTLADIAGVPAYENDGVSIYPTLVGKQQPEHEYLYFEFPSFAKERGRGWLSIRQGKWKGLVTGVEDGNTTMQLYDIVADPREEHDLAAENQDVVKRMWQYIKESHTPSSNPKFNLHISYPE